MTPYPAPGWNLKSPGEGAVLISELAEPDSVLRTFAFNPDDFKAVYFFLFRSWEDKVEGVEIPGGMWYKVSSYRRKFGRRKVMIIYLNVNKLPDIIRRAVKSTDSYTLQPEGIEIIRMQGQENDKAFFVIPNTSALCSLNELPLVSRDQVSKAIAWVEITQRVDKKIRHGDYSAGLFRAFALESSTSGSDITVAGPNYESAIRLFAGILSGSANPKEVF